MKKLIIILFFLPAFAFSQGTFDVVYTTTDSMVYDTPGAFMSIHTTIHNLSATDSVKLNIFKQFIDIPLTWETAICTDVCYPSTVNSVNLSLAPSDSQEFVFYFYTDLVADSGYAKVLYTNLNIPSNTVLHGYHGITQSPLGISEKEEATFSVYPNPATDVINVKSNSTGFYIISDALGCVVLKGRLATIQSSIAISNLSKGFYFLTIQGQGKSVKILKQ